MNKQTSFNKKLRRFFLAGLAFFFLFLQKTFDPSGPTHAAVAAKKFCLNTATQSLMSLRSWNVSDPEAASVTSLIHMFDLIWRKLGATDLSVVGTDWNHFGVAEISTAWLTAINPVSWAETQELEVQIERFFRFCYSQKKTELRTLCFGTQAHWHHRWGLDCQNSVINLDLPQLQVDIFLSLFSIWLWDRSLCELAVQGWAQNPGGSEGGSQ